MLPFSLHLCVWESWVPGLCLQTSSSSCSLAAVAVNHVLTTSCLVCPALLCPLAVTCPCGHSRSWPIPSWVSLLLSTVMLPATTSPTSLPATHGASAQDLTVAPQAAGTLPRTSVSRVAGSTTVQAAASGASTPSAFKRSCCRQLCLHGWCFWFWLLTLCSISGSWLAVAVSSVSVRLLPRCCANPM
jgi:hypothetical protein